MRWHAQTARGKSALSHVHHDVCVRVRDWHIHNVRRPFRIMSRRRYDRNAIDGCKGVPTSRRRSQTTLVFVLVQIHLVHNLTQANRIPAYWRSVNLTSGVSGLLPEIFLLAGAYRQREESAHGISEDDVNRQSANVGRAAAHFKNERRYGSLAFTFRIESIQNPVTRAPLQPKFPIWPLGQY